MKDFLLPLIVIFAVSFLIYFLQAITHTVFLNGTAIFAVSFFIALAFFNTTNTTVETQYVNQDQFLQGFESQIEKQGFQKVSTTGDKIIYKPGKIRQYLMGSITLDMSQPNKVFITGPRAFIRHANDKLLTGLS